MVLIASCMMAAVLVASAYVALAPKRYRAIARVVLMTERHWIPGPGSAQDLVAPAEDNVALQTQVQVLKSKRLATRVMRTLDLERDPTFPPPTLFYSNQRLTEQSGAIADYLRDHLKTSLSRNTRVVEMQFTDRLPARSAAIVNAWIDAYEQEEIGNRRHVSSETGKLLREELSELQAQVQRSDNLVAAFQKEHGILGTDEKSNVITAKLEELNRALTQAETLRMEKQAALKTVSATEGEQVSAVGDQASLSTLRMELTAVRSELAQVTTMYGPAYPRVRELTSKAGELEKFVGVEVDRVRARARNEYAAAKSNEVLLRRAYRAQMIEANRLNDAAAEFGILKRDAESNRHLYDSVLSKMKEADAAAALGTGNMRVIDRAEAPQEPISPDAKVDLSCGAVLGCLLGIGIGLARDNLRTGMSEPTQVEGIFGLPMVGTIPLLRSTIGQRIRMRWLPAVMPAPVTLEQPRSELAEAYRSLATFVMKAPEKVIVCTSAVPEEGKTTTCANLAVVLAQQGKRVLLVDADLRKPSIARTFALPSMAGLSEMLEGERAGDFSQLRGIGSLKILQSGTPPLNAAEMLGSERMAELVRRWRQEFDHVLLDSPPVLAVTDALRLAEHADGVLLVVRAGRTSAEMLVRLRNLLFHARIKVVGGVMNEIDRRQSSDYGSYNSSSWSKYYLERMRA